MSLIHPRFCCMRITSRLTGKLCKSCLLGGIRPSQQNLVTVSRSADKQSSQAVSFQALASQPRSLSDQESLDRVGVPKLKEYPKTNERTGQSGDRSRAEAQFSTQKSDQRSQGSGKVYQRAQPQSKNFLSKPVKGQKKVGKSRRNKQSDPAGSNNDIGTAEMQQNTSNKQVETGAADSQPAAKRRKVGGKRKTAFTPEQYEYRLRIVDAARTQDPKAAIDAYDEANAKGIKVGADSLNTLLFLCAGGDEWQEKFQHLPIPWMLGHNVKHGEESPDRQNSPRKTSDNEALANGSTTKVKVELSILQAKAQQILIELKAVCNKGLSEITYTGLARLAAAGGRADDAYQLGLDGQAAGVPARLRTFLPSLLAYTTAGNFEGAMKVIDFLKSVEVDLTETEHAVSVLACQHTKDSAEAEKVLRRIGTELTYLHPKTIQAAETYFRSDNAQAGLGEGEEWHIERCTVNQDGQTSTCGGVLQAVDLDENEWSNFEEGIAKLAVSKERNPDDFKQFQVWLEKHGPFKQIVDAANVAFFGQNYEEGEFQFSQIGDVVETLASEDSDDKSLVILHKRRTKDGPARKDSAQELLKALEEENVIYATPYGSNDDWYWMYAAVKAGTEGVVVSNDEMRDHIFQMLAPKFFLKWKQRHQMKYKFTGEGLELYRPPKFTACTQKLSNGSWVFPIAESDEWFCARPVKSE